MPGPQLRDGQARRGPLTPVRPSRQERDPVRGQSPGETRGKTGRLTWLAAAAAALLWLPFLTKPLSPDEGGFLLVASQWQPGRSL
jgi:hypothetical protein